MLSELHFYVNKYVATMFIELPQLMVNALICVNKIKRFGLNICESYSCSALYENNMKLNPATVY